MESTFVLPPATDYGYKIFEDTDGKHCMRPSLDDELVTSSSRAFE